MKQFETAWNVFAEFRPQAALPAAVPNPVHPVHPVASRRGGTFRNGVDRFRSFHSEYRCDGSYARVSCSGWALSAGSTSRPLARRIRPTSATMRSIRAWCAATLFHVRYSEATM
jgi:hypothetical protein